MGTMFAHLNLKGELTHIPATVPPSRLFLTRIHHGTRGMENEAPSAVQFRALVLLVLIMFCCAVASSEWPFAAVGASQGPAGSMHGPALWPVTSAARPISPAFCSSDRRSSGFRFSSSNFSAQDQRRLGAADAALTGMCSSVAGQSHAEQRSGRHYRSFATSQTASPPAREALGPDSSPPGTEAETSPGLASPSPGAQLH